MIARSALATVSGAVLLGTALLLAPPAAAAAATPDQQAPSAGRPELRPLPDPPLDRVDEAVRERLEDHERSLGADLAEPSTDRRRLTAGFARLGQLYLLFDLDAAARDAFWNARQLDPGDGRWSYYLGVALERLGRNEEAAEALGRVLEARPQDEATLVRLGRIAVAADRVEEAERYFRLALEHHSRSAAALHGLGQVAAFRERWQEAVELFERALGIQPGASAVHYELGLAHRQLGDLERARDHLAQRGPIKPRFHDPLISDLETLAPGARTHNRRGTQLFSIGDLAGAEDAYRKAIEVEPDDPTAHAALADILDLQDRASEAISEYRTALELDPSSPQNHHQLGRLLLRIGWVEEAIGHLRQAVALAPDFGEAYGALALALERAGRIEEAVEAAGEAVEIEPESGSARLRLARLSMLRQIDPWGDPETELLSVLEADPRDRMALLALGHHYRSAGRIERALATYRRVLDLPGDERRHRVLRARAHLSVAELLAGDDPGSETAVSHLREAVRLAPDQGDVHLALGRVLAARGDHEGAAHSYGLALGVDPSDLDAHLALAEALIRAGRHRDALERLEEGMARFHRDPRVADLLARLLATSSKETVRDGERALELARGAFDAQQSARHAETVAMAQAELGRFEEAVDWQRRAIDLTAGGGAGGGSGSRSELERRLERYRSGEPVRSPWGGGS